MNETMVEVSVLPSPQSPPSKYTLSSSHSSPSTTVTPTTQIRASFDKMIIVPSSSSSSMEEPLPAAPVTSAGSNNNNNPSPARVSPLEDEVAPHRLPFKKRLGQIHIVKSSWRSLDDSDDEEQEDDEHDEAASIPPLLVRQCASVFTVTALHAAFLLRYSSFNHNQPLLPYRYTGTMSRSMAAPAASTLFNSENKNVSNQHLRQDPSSFVKIEQPSSSSLSALQLGRPGQRTPLYPSVPDFASEGLVRVFHDTLKRQESSSPIPTKKHGPRGAKKSEIKAKKGAKKNLKHPPPPPPPVPHGEIHGVPGTYRAVVGHNSTKNCSMLELHQMLLAMNSRSLDDLSQVIVVPPRSKSPPSSAVVVEEEDPSISRRDLAGLKPAPIYSTTPSGPPSAAPGDQHDMEHHDYPAWRVGHHHGLSHPQASSFVFEEQFCQPSPMANYRVESPLTPTVDRSHGRLYPQQWMDATGTTTNFATKRVDGPQPPFSPIASLRSMFGPSLEPPPRRTSSVMSSASSFHHCRGGPGQPQRPSRNHMLLRASADPNCREDKRSIH